MYLQRCDTAASISQCDTPVESQLSVFYYYFIALAIALHCSSVWLGWRNVYAGNLDGCGRTSSRRPTRDVSVVPQRLIDRPIDEIRKSANSGPGMRQQKKGTLFDRCYCTATEKSYVPDKNRPHALLVTRDSRESISRTISATLAASTL